LQQESGMPFAQVNGQNIYYEDTGGRGPAIVFSHGLLMDHTMFEPQIQALQGQYRCISWDERGHGQTADPEHCEAFSYYDSADDLAALLKYLGVEKAVLVGMSQGGYLSLRCALIHPDVVGALVLIDTQAMLEDPSRCRTTRRCSRPGWSMGCRMTWPPSWSTRFWARAGPGLRSGAPNGSRPRRSTWGRALRRWRCAMTSARAWPKSRCLRW
jgi:pimeloyl-ACP methyl ester carboxylesterase